MVFGFTSFLGYTFISSIRYCFLEVMNTLRMSGGFSLLRNLSRLRRIEVLSSLLDTVTLGSLELSSFLPSLTALLMGKVVVD